jgi:hypothetical protein
MKEFELLSADFLGLDQYQKLKFTGGWPDVMAILDKIEIMGYITMITTHSTIIKEVSGPFQCSVDGCDKLISTREAIMKFYGK